ncbi:flagellar hook protein FlgE [Chitinilyticum aquatile]|uniref:flagellar hook protein FlgE n=1 Tax=Chitinilyticum aquatile TaxID=362520 RepID=UPI0004248D32|nr:flagellar hook protein FlgE [Chitinilyticum aquatile]
MGFQQGLSGLNASSKNLDVIGNNVANSQTVGFKSSRTEFADIYASTFGSASNLAGIGVSVAAISQQFGQGNLTTTNNPLDVAITGNGFFRMSDQSGAISYARNGQFQVDKQGYIVNGGNGLFLTGWPVDAATNQFLEGSTPQPIKLEYSNIGAQATGASGSSNAGLQLGVNLNAQAKVIPAATPFSSSDPTTYNYATSATIYDSLGVSHTQTMYFRRLDPVATPNTWDVHFSVDGVDLPALTTQLVFDTNGKLDLTATTNPTPISIPLTNGATTPLAFNMYFDKSTQYGSPNTVNSLTQDGYTDGVLTGISVSDEGVIQGRYSNSQTRNVAKVVLASFVNSQGLQPLGNNLWAESFSSGQPLINAPGAGSTGKLQSATVEDSNVDLTAELVNLIVAQRTYQANAQTISAQNTIMQTLVNL